MKISKKQKIFLTIGFILYIIIVLSPIAGKFKEKFQQHITFRYVINLPDYNGIPRMYITTKSGLAIKSRDSWIKGTFDLKEGKKTLCSGKTKIKGHGNSTWSYHHKKAYGLKLDKPNELLGMSSSRKWILLNPYWDKSLLRNDFGLNIGHTIYKNQLWIPSVRDIEVVMNGKYLGVYELAEQIRIAPNRVNIPDISKKHNGGYVAEVDCHMKEIRNFYSTVNQVPFNIKYPKKISDKLYTQIKDHIEKTEQVLYSADFLNPRTGYRKYIDTKSVIDWYLVNEITKNHDAKFHSSVYMVYDPKDKLFHMGPLWDFDISCGNINYDGCENPEGFYIKNARWIEQMFKDPQFIKELQDRWNKTKNDLYKSIQTYIPEHARYLNQARLYNFKAWKLIGVKIWPDYVVPKTYQGEVDYLQSWLIKRYKWMDTAIQNLTP